MLNKEIHNIFEKYIELYEQQNLGTLVGATGGGEGGDWAGSLPKLISILPMGNWKATSLKRSRVNTKSGFTSDHYEGNQIAYAADFGLNTTFNSNADSATNFAIKVARNAGGNVSSWQPYVGNSFKINTSDGYRIQIIWQSNVGGNHYDHVHVGVKKIGSGESFKLDSDSEYNNDSDTVEQNNQSTQTKQQNKEEDSPFTSGLSQKISDIYNKAGGITAASAKEALKTAVNTGLGLINKYSK
jgi:hypothetical protein